MGLKVISKKSKHVKYICSVLFGMFFLFSADILTAQDNFEIRKISFTGNKTLKKDFIADKMILKEVSWFDKTVRKKEPFLYSSKLEEADLERIRQVYQSEGFINAEVTSGEAEINHKKQTVKISFKISEGESVKVDSISVKFSQTSANFDTDSLINSVSKKLSLKKGSRFRDKNLINDLSLFEEEFKNIGYAYATADYRLNLEPQNFSTGITYIINTGPVTHLGETSVSGNKYVSENFIKKQLKYEAGDVYKKSQLDKTRNELYNLELFRIVSVLPERDSETKKTPMPVKIHIEETPRLSSRFGAGYGTEERFRAFADLTLRKFPGGAQRLNMYVKHSYLEPYSVRLRWIYPRFLGVNSTLAVNPFLMRNREPGYDISSYGINIPFTYRFTSSTTGKITYYLEDVRQNIETGDTEFTDSESTRFLYNKSGIQLSGIFNSSAPSFSPDHGINLSVDFKINGHIFGSRFNYTRLLADFRTYHKIGESVLAFRMMTGGINSADSDGFIPVEDRFYSGGSNSIRGWRRAALGPKRTSGTPLGGKSIFESNLEIRIPVVWRLSIAAFVEAGNVWEKSWTIKPEDLGYAAGSGLRIETPIGPVRFDAAVPLWNEKKSMQFFLSVGQAF